MTTNFEQGLDVAGNVNLTGNITVGGNTITGDADTDNVTFNADISSHIIPDLDKTYSLGTITKRWDNIFGDSLNLESDLSAASAVITNSVTAEEFISTSTGTPTLSSGSDININPTGQVNVTSDMEVTGNLLVQGLLSNLTNWSIVENSGVLTFTNSSTSNNITMQNGVDGELALQSDLTTAVTGLASEQYVQNYVAANSGGGTIPVASSPEIVLSGVTESAISVTGVENGQVIIAFLSDTSTSNMSTFIQIWDQAGWAGFNPSSTQLSSTSSAAIKWVNTTGVTKDVYVRAQLTTTSSVGRVLIMKFAEDFAGDYNDLTNTPTIPTDVSQLTDTTNVIPSDVGDLTDTTNVIPSDVGDLTDNSGLLGGGGGLGNVIDFGFLGTAYGGTSTTRDFSTPVVVAPGQTVTGWSSYQLAPAVAWRDNYQGTPNTLGTTTYTNSTGSNVTVYARANTSNSNNVGVHYMLLG